MARKTGVPGPGAYRTKENTGKGAARPCIASAGCAQSRASCPSAAACSQGRPHPVKLAYAGALQVWHCGQGCSREGLSWPRAGKLGLWEVSYIPLAVPQDALSHASGHRVDIEKTAYDARGCAALAGTVRGRMAAQQSGA